MEQSIWLDGPIAPGRSRTLRELVTRLCESLLGVKVAEEATSVVNDPWTVQEQAAAPAKTTQRKRRRAAATAKQIEFGFNAEPGSELSEEDAPAEPMTEEAYMLAEDLVELRPLSDAMEPTQHPVDPMQQEWLEEPQGSYVERGRFAGLLNMGAGLKLSGALDGARPQLRRFRLPRQRFMPSLRLWNESATSPGRITDLRFPPRDISSHGPRRADGNLIV